MTGNNNTAMARGGEVLFGEASKNWGWFLALGIIFVILGCIGLGMTFFLTMASVLFFGVLLLVGAGVQVADAFKARGWKGVIGHVLIALLYVLGGIAVIRNPIGTSMILTLIIGAVILTAGVVRIVLGFEHRGTLGWSWMLLGGVVSLFLGMIILSQWPVSGLWIIGLFIAVEMIINGWSYIMVALGARYAHKAMMGRGAMAAASP